MKIMFLAIRARTDALSATIVLASRNVNPRKIYKDSSRYYITSIELSIMD